MPIILSDSDADTIRRALETLKRIESKEGMIRPQQRPHRYYPGEADAETVIVKLTGDESGGGKYSGRILTGTSSATGSGNLAAADLGTVPGSDDALVLNLQEVGQSTHDIDTGGTQIYFFGTIKGYTSETPARAIVVIDGAQWANCT